MFVFYNLEGEIYYVFLLSPSMLSQYLKIPIPPIKDMAQAIHVLIVSLGTLLFTQVLKFFIFGLSTKRWNFSILFEDGHMPSTHSATLTSLATTFYLIDGFSPLFVLSLFFALFVIHDAFHVRREVGMHASFLNKLKGKQIFKETTGHSWKEVLVGVVLGYGVAMAYGTFFL